MNWKTPTWDELDTVWEHPDDVPFPEGAEIDLDAIGREDLDEEQGMEKSSRDAG